LSRLLPFVDFGEDGLLPCEVFLDPPQYLVLLLELLVNTLEAHLACVGLGVRLPLPIPGASGQQTEHQESGNPDCASFPHGSG
jgi:hypothetical protein